MPPFCGLYALRPLERTGGERGGRRGPTMASRGSEEEDVGEGERLVVWRLGLGGLEVVDLRFGLRERVRSRCRLCFLCFEE